MNEYDIENYIKALNALKMQANAVKANDFKGDKKLLSEAQQSMMELEPYTASVYRLLRGNSEGVDIETADNIWLQKALKRINAV